jgi:hypothetical protein
LALLTFFVGDLVGEEHQEAVFVASLVALWMGGASFAYLASHLTSLLVLAAGLVWGFLLALTAAICIQNGHLSINWLPFVLALLLGPLALTLTLLPVYFARAKLFHFGTMLVGLLALAAISTASHLALLPLVHRLTAPPADYDLEAVKAVISPNPAIFGEKMTEHEVVRNSGPSTVPGGTYEVEFYIDNRLVSFDRATSTLGPRHEIAYSSRLQCDFAPGVHSFRLIVDPENRLKEIDESNNILTGTFEVIKAGN